MSYLLSFPTLRKSLAAGVFSAVVGVSIVPCIAFTQDTGMVEAQALVRFNRGREHFMAQRWEPALAEFRAALSLVGSPNTRLYIARCLKNLNRNAEAFFEFQRAGAEASDRAAREPRYVTTRDNARTEAALIEPLLGQVTVHVASPPTGIEVRVGTTPLPAAMWTVPMPVDPGDVTVTAQAPGYRPFSTHVSVTAHGQAEVSVTMEALPAATGTLGGSAVVTTPLVPVVTPPTVVHEQVQVGGAVRWVGVVLGLVGVGGMGAFVGFGSLAQNRYNDLVTLCGNTGCPESQINEGVQYQTFANVGLTVGAIGITAGLIMIIAGGPRTEERTRTVTAMPWVSPLDGHGLSVGLHGTM